MSFCKSKMAATLCLFLLASCLRTYCVAQEGSTVVAQVIVNHARNASHAGNEGVVVWLKPLGTAPHRPPKHPQHYQIIQKDKQFTPHVLAVPVGTSVEFPNLDPWFHNVFSLYKGQKFDLGLYEAGSSRAVRFDHPGVSFIFCNIHPEMSAYVLALETPYFAISSKQGQIKIAYVPPGRYRLGLWYERAESSEVAKLSREVTVSGQTTSLGILTINESPLSIPPHTDKHGQSYSTDQAPY